MSAPLKQFVAGSRFQVFLVLVATFFACLSWVIILWLTDLSKDNITDACSACGIAGANEGPRARIMLSSKDIYNMGRTYG
ncbi:hypothetical protein BDZ45DRAFT_747520 [Acephala macrosclerotiorum]|nr:hypothetical protein BDZ45DRAFT_747520 [Acephala macrosclerotiorum]